MDTNASEQPMRDTGTAGVMARPTRLFPAALLFGLVLDRLVPLPFAVPADGVVHSVSVIIAAASILTGIALFGAGVRNFSRAATPLPTNQPARVLVTTGVHSRTRNPVYLGFFLIYVGIGTAVHSEWILVLTVAVAVVVRYGVVEREEVYLERRFGQAYRDYKARVRRWV